MTAPVPTSEFISNAASTPKGSNAEILQSPKPVVQEPKKTISIIIRIENEAGLEVHEVTMNYEGLAHDTKNDIYSFYGKPSSFQNETLWKIQTARMTTPENIVKGMQQEEKESK